MADEKIIELKYPIPVPKEGGGTVDVSQLTLRRLKVGFLRVLPKNCKYNEEGEIELEPAEMIPLIAAMTNVPESSIDEMDFEDVMLFAEAVEDFLAELPQIGKK